MSTVIENLIYIHIKNKQSCSSHCFSFVFTFYWTLIFIKSFYEHEANVQIIFSVPGATFSSRWSPKSGILLCGTVLLSVNHRLRSSASERLFEIQIIGPSRINTFQDGIQGFEAMTFMHTKVLKPLLAFLCSWSYHIVSFYFVHA